MKLFSHNTKTFHKKHRLNPANAWIALCTVSIVVLIIELCYFSWFFVYTTNSLDTPATPDLQTNAEKIQKIERIVTTVERAVGERAGASSER